MQCYETNKPRIVITAIGFAWFFMLGFLGILLVLMWACFKEEDEYTGEQESCFDFYNTRLYLLSRCTCCSTTNHQPVAVEMTNPYREELDVLDQAQWKIQGDDLSLGKRIGAGGCGWVYQGTLGGSGASVPVACKEVISATIDPEDLKEFQHEARMMTQLHHPYVITFYGVCEKIVANEHTGDPEQRMYMVTELAPGGSLEGHIEDAILAKKLIASGQAKRDTKLPFDGTQMVKWALQIAAGKATFFCCSPLDVWSYLISVCLLLFFCFRHGPHSWPWFHTSRRQTTQCLAQRYQGCFDL